jgi:hypothetical protein
VTVRTLLEWALEAKLEAFPQKQRINAAATSVAALFVRDH